MEVTFANNSAGGYVTVNMMAGSFGIGLHRDSSEGESEQNTFVSYVAPLPVEGSKIKVGYGVSKAGDNEVGLFRIRFNYAFLSPSDQNIVSNCNCFGDMDEFPVPCFARRVGHFFERLYAD